MQHAIKVARLSTQRAVAPEHRARRQSWINPESRKAKLESIAQALNVAKPEDWYRVRKSDIMKHGGGSILHHHNRSHSKAITELYPEHHWKPWMFAGTPSTWFDSKENVDRFIADFQKTHSIASIEQWYSIGLDEVINHGGRLLLAQHGQSLARLLAHVYPNHSWEEWKFQRAPANFWSSVPAQRRLFDSIQRELGMKDLSEFYRLRKKDVEPFGALSIIVSYYNDSLVSALTTIYSEHQWLPWKFTAIPRRYWSDPSNQRAFLEHVMREEGLHEVAQLRSLTVKDISRHGGGGWIKSAGIGGSPMKILRSAYPNIDWGDEDSVKVKPKRMSKQPADLADVQKQDRKVLEAAALALNLTDLSGWYGVKREDVRRHVKGMLNRYKHSHVHALKVLYPEHAWQDWNFSQLRRGWFDVKENRLQFMEALALSKNIEKMEDWYNVEAQDVIDFGGFTLTNSTKHSIANLLQAVYPNHEWLAWRFRSVPRGSWSSPEFQKNFFEWLRMQQGLATLSDMYSLTAQQVKEAGGSMLVSEKGGLVKALRSAYPEHNWEDHLFQR